MSFTGWAVFVLLLLSGSPALTIPVFLQSPALKLPVQSYIAHTKL